MRQYPFALGLPHYFRKSRLFCNIVKICQTGIPGVLLYKNEKLNKSMKDKKYANSDQSVNISLVPF
jgi:hypothetical protein